jgi:hypothetical protein
MSYNAQKKQGKEAMRQAMAAKAMADYQAKLDVLRAGVAEKQGAVEQRTSDIMFGQKLSGAKTMIASNGLLLGAGSAGDYEMSAVEQHAMEKSIIAQNTNIKEWSFLADAKMHRMEGIEALRGGMFAKKSADSNAIGTLLGTVGSMGMMAASMGGSSSSFGKSPTLTGDANSFSSGNGLGSGGQFTNNLY